MLHNVPKWDVWLILTHANVTNINFILNQSFLVLLEIRWPFLPSARMFRFFAWIERTRIRGISKAVWLKSLFTGQLASWRTIKKTTAFAPKRKLPSVKGIRKWSEKTAKLWKTRIFVPFIDVKESNSSQFEKNFSLYKLQFPAAVIPLRK